MPRSNDGRWTHTCEVCGKEFQQRRPGIRTCGVKCRAKLPHNQGGHQPQSGLLPQQCVICGKEFVPYRDGQETCSTTCYWKSERGQASRKRQDLRRRIDEEAAARKRDYNRRMQLKIKYGMTVSEHDAKLEAQGGVCKICGKPPNPNGTRAASRLHIDHDHATGKNRDLICTSCNQGLGYFKDDPALLREAAAYIERHRSAQEGSV